MTSSDHQPERPFTLLRATSARHAMTALALAVAAAAGLYLAWLSPAQRAAFGADSVTGTFALLVVLALGHRGCRFDAAERRFWRDLRIAYSLWVGIALLLVWPGATGTATRLAAEIGTALFYVLFVRAVESQPHHLRATLSELTRRLNLAAIVCFVFGLLTYFWLIPGVLFPGAGAPALLLSSVYLYATLDALLTLRLFFLARRAGSRRWRRIYTLTMATTATMLAGDLVGSVSSFTEANYFYSASMVFVIVAARSRRHEGDTAEIEPPGTPDGHPDRTWQSVIYTLTLPLIDLAIFRLGLLDPGHRTARATFVLLWTPLLGAIALLQNRQLERARQRVLRELRAKNAELERFTYAVSHDLKAPLVTIQGFLGMLERDAAAGDAKRFEADVARIRNAARSMARLVDDLLELSRIGAVVKRGEEVSLREVAEEAVELLAAEIEDRGVEVEVSPGLPVVNGDRPRLLQVFQNLIGNAVKYMGEQSAPRIDVGTRQQRGEEIVTVRDNGSGIDPEYQDGVFDLFSRLETEVGGTGVGLALVQRIVESHGGRIWVESPGREQGSTFCFTLANRVGDAGAP